MYEIFSQCLVKRDTGTGETAHSLGRERIVLTPDVLLYALHHRMGKPVRPVRCTTLFVTVLGLVCAITPLGKLPAANELSSVLLYAVVALLATQAPLNALIEAPMWVVYGVFVLVLHVVGMYILSKLFPWDLCMVSTASVANIGGPASAPIIAVAYNPNYAGIGVLMGIFGQAIGNFAGLGMGWLLNLMA